MSKTLTLAEAAKILKISKYTLYVLIKRGEIPVQRVGQQIRINPDILDRYLNGVLHTGTPPAPIQSTSPADDANAHSASDSGVPHLRFVGSHDPAVELLFEFLKHSSKPVETSLSFSGSTSGLIALYNGEAEISGIHLWDEAANEYNLPFVKHFLMNESVCVVNLVQREQGFIVAPGNPHQIQTWTDLAKRGVRFINRQKGSGTRLRLEGYIKAAKIPFGRITGYDKVEYTHTGVAYRVAKGLADVGVGVKSAALRLGLDFIPLYNERYDLVFLGRVTKTSVWRQFQKILSSPGFTNAVQQQGGYDTTMTGLVLLDA